MYKGVFNERTKGGKEAGDKLGVEGKRMRKKRYERERKRVN